MNTKKAPVKLSLAERMIALSNSKFAKPLSQSFLLKRASVYHNTHIPMLNLALSGDFNLGLPAGITMIGSPPKHFKSLFGLHCVEAYLRDVPDGVVLFYDTEFGISQEYLQRFDLDFDRIIHIPITTIEELRTELSVQLKDLYNNFKETGKINDKIMIFVDSIGNVPSEKEVTDAENDKNSADMTRAKVIKSMFRIITTKINMMNIPMVVINHSYQTLDLFSKTVISGGSGAQYAASNILTITKAQETDAAKNLKGFQFTLVPNMSRYVKEKAKIPIKVFFDRGIPKYSGLMDLAKEYGYISECRVGKKGGWKFTFNPGEGEEEKEWVSTTAEIHDNSEFWEAIFKYTDFNEVIRQNYSTSSDRAGHTVNISDMDKEFNKFEDDDEE